MQGPYSLNGYRVRVYRQDSATQWFTGIITHHDLFTRTMIVMNDQVKILALRHGEDLVPVKVATLFTVIIHVPKQIVPDQQ